MKLSGESLIRWSRREAFSDGSIQADSYISEPIFDQRISARDTGLNWAFHKKRTSNQKPLFIKHLDMKPPPLQSHSARFPVQGLLFHPL